jgi:hypothetical protein
MGLKPMPPGIGFAELLKRNGRFYRAERLGSGPDRIARQPLTCRQFVALDGIPRTTMILLHGQQREYAFLYLVDFKGGGGF